MSTKNTTATSHVINLYLIKLSNVSEKFVVVNAQLNCTIIFVTFEDSIGRGHGILSQAQGEGQEMSFRSLGRVTSFSALNLKPAPPPP